ncbi:MAG: hypothetical protein HY033_06250, partial [Ignavibacteriae bacterium]|nr:hypothetical protein [Ignavibacteria bacterium]MBI3364493.1 hypothetical protein [Ignavibacteriota bacterium]
MKKLPLPSLLFFAILFTQPASAQKRLLVNQFGDAITLTKGSSAISIIKEATSLSAAQDCGIATFGFEPLKYPPASGGQYALHKDIMGMWFEAPASGRIDTVYWIMNGVCRDESTLSLRIFNSNIYTGHGPGYDGYPAPSLSTCWGYYLSTADQEDGIAAFPEDAAGPDTTWQSTVTSGPGPSYPPIAKGIWGLSGVPVNVHANKINKFDLNLVTELNVTEGDRFFITLRLGGHAGDACTPSTADVFTRSLEPDPLLTHDWKFYENVAVFPGAVCKGWVARGEWNLLFWYSMTPTSNTPPNIISEPLHNTTSTDVRDFTAVITDCDAFDTLRAGVQSAFIRYTANGGASQVSPMLYLTADQWEATIPGQSVGSTVSYRIIAVDSLGLADSSGLNTYRIISPNSLYYRADTTTTCTPASIHSAPAIGASDWFVDSARAGTGSHRGDDGTAGPFSLGGPFVYYGDTVNYAWIGVNGAMALTKSATDTDDVNLNGFATGGWDLPNRQH